MPKTSFTGYPEHNIAGTKVPDGSGFLGESERNIEKAGKTSGGRMTKESDGMASKRRAPKTSKKSGAY